MSVEQVRETVRPAFEKGLDGFWEHHIVLVHKYAVLLAERLHADREVCELAAYLHDYGRVMLPARKDEHHLTGAGLAKEVLEGFGYAPDTVAHVQACIRTHRGSVDLAPATVEARIVANADAMAHIDAVPWFLHLRFTKGDDPDAAAAWVRAKLERDWTKKLTLPEARVMVKEKYAAAKLLLDATLAVQDE